MTIADKVRAFLRSREPAAQHVEIEAAIREATAELAQHRGRRGPVALAALAGDPTAATQLHAIDTEVAMLESRLSDLRDAAGEAERRAAEGAAQARQRAEEARQREIAELAAGYAKRAQRIDALMGEAADELRELVVGNARLVALLPPGAARMFEAGSVMSRTATRFAALFALDPANPRGQLRANNILGLEAGQRGADFWRRFADVEVGIVDDLVTRYPSEAEAEAAVARLAGRGIEMTMALLCPGVWTLAVAKQEAA